MINYATSKGIVTIESRTDDAGRTQTETLVGSDISEISKSLIKAREIRIAAEAELANTLTGNALANAPTIGAMRQRKAEGEAELARLRTIFAEDYPEVAARRAELANLERSIGAETARSSQSNREAFDAAVKRERDLEAALNALTNKYNVQQRESIELAILQREVDSNRQLYDGLLQRYKEAADGACPVRGTRFRSRKPASCRTHSRKRAGGGPVGRRRRVPMVLVLDCRSDARRFRRNRRPVARFIPDSRYGRHSRRAI